MHGLGTIIETSGVGIATRLHSASRAVTPARSTSPTGEDPGSSSSAGDGKGFADLALKVAIFSGLGKQALDGVRVVPKLKESLHAREFMENGGQWSLGKVTIRHGTGRLPTAIRQMITMQPSTTIIDPTAPNIKALAPELHAAALAKSAGRTFTNFDRSAFITSTLLGAGLATVTLASGVPNLASGVMQDGPQGLIQTEEGRAGLIQTSGGGLALWLLAGGMKDVAPDLKAQKLARVTANASRSMTGGKPGAYQRMPAAVRSVYEGLHHVAAGARAPRNALPWTAGAGLASAALLWINRWGYLDGLNSNDDRSFGTKMHDALASTPVLGMLA